MLYLKYWLTKFYKVHVKQARELLNIRQNLDKNSVQLSWTVWSIDHGKSP